MLTQLSRLVRDIRGNTLMLPAIGGIALIGGAGLGVDTVQWYLWKRQLDASKNHWRIAA